MKHKSGAQMAAKLTHIFQHFQLSASSQLKQQSSRSEKKRRGTQQHEGSRPAQTESDGECATDASLLTAALAGRLRAFIRHHSTLYLRVLLLQTVDLQSLHVCCCGAGIAVSREQLVQFLDEEGVAFAQTPNARNGNRSRQKRHRAE